jgi:membrane-associated protease RseP (regulator of RpoE activity)
MIQTSAAVSGGNSGGPLINAVGDQIGIVTSKKLDGENINFAIAVDRVREMFPVLLSAELRYGFRLGIEVDMYTAEAEVTSVTKGSPAAKAGIELGDVIQSLNTKLVRSGIDFHLGLIGRTAGENLTVGIRRGTEVVVTEAKLAELEQAEPIPDEGMIPGLAFEGFDGKWDQLPNFDELKPVKTGWAETPTAEAYKTASGDHYALRFAGFLKIPREGLYTFYTSSDDGSRFKIGSEVVVNNDGLHGVLRSGGVARLRKGLHPVEVTFFEQGGDEKLVISWEGPEMNLEVIPAEAWFVKGEEKTDAQSP